MTHKEMTLHIRRRLAAAGIKSRCAMQDYCGKKIISIDTPSYEATFTEEQQTLIFNIVTANRLTAAQGMPVVNNGTMTHGGKFEFVEVVQ